MSLILLLSTSCSKFRRIQNSPDWRLKYDAALAYYEDEEYYKANVLLEEILPIIRGTKEAELGNFIFAYTYYHLDQFILSAHHFKDFVRVFGRSEYVQEARFMNAFSLYMQSPEYNLDQTSTLEALAALQEYINLYPASSATEEAEQLMDELERKLEKKAFENARLYYKIRRYKSALIIFENFHRDYPDSKFREEVYFMGIETIYEYAKVSIPEKQEERYQETIKRYQDFVDKYPNSRFLENASQFYEKSRDELANFANSRKPEL